MRSVSSRRVLLESQRPRASLLLLLSITALFAVGCRNSAPPAPAVTAARDDNAPIRITAAVSTAQTRPVTLALTGTLIPDLQSEVTALVAGRVEEVLVERGTTVQEGQPMFRLRDSDYRTTAAAAAAAVSQARSRIGYTAGPFNPESLPEVRAARTNRDLAEDALRRAQQLAATGAVSEQDLLRARAQADAAREQYSSATNNARGAYFALQSAQNQASQSQRALSDSVVRAPFTGEIAERKTQVGEYVTPQRALVTLVRVDPLRIELQVPQNRIPFIRRGQEVELRVDAYPDQVFRGTIRYLSAAVQTNTRSMAAEAVVPNPQGTLRPGFFVNARVALGSTERVVSVPATAVISDAGSHRVFVINEGRAQERVITIADRTSQEVLISAGIEAGERIATGGLDRLFDGARVQEQ